MDELLQLQTPSQKDMGNSANQTVKVKEISKNSWED